MRTKILFVTLTAVALALVAFGVPLALLISQNVTGQERSELERLALRAAVRTSLNDVPGTRLNLPPDSEFEPVGLYDASGRRVEGTGPSRLEAHLRPSLNGSIAQASTESTLVVAVPVSANQHVIGVVRAASPLAEVGRQIHRDWLVLGLLGAAAAAVAGVIAMIQSRRLARPLQRLERVAIELGDGNLGARAPASGVSEIDRASRALNATAARLSALIAREQAFSAHASHQLRTPLTGLRLHLEAGLESGGVDLETAARNAIRSADELSRTIDDVVSLARRSAPQGPLMSVGEVLDDMRRRWAPLLSSQGRDIDVVTDDPPLITTPFAAVRQVLDVLVDNAYRHGKGNVTVRARTTGGALAVDVIDEGHEAGTLLPPTSQGLGLALAQSTAAGQGGRLLQATEETQTQLTLLIPAAET